MDHGGLRRCRANHAWILAPKAMFFLLECSILKRPTLAKKGQAMTANDNGKKISADGIALIKSFEGLYLRAYRCPAGVLTIGWGSTEGVREGAVISEDEAEEMLHKELERFEEAVNHLVKVPLTQHQFDALVSFSYNVGSRALEHSTLLRKLNDGDYNAVPAELGRWVRGGGRVLQGLVRRRRAEGMLWAKPDRRDAA